MQVTDALEPGSNIIEPPKWYIDIGKSQNLDLCSYYKDEEFWTKNPTLADKGIPYYDRLYLIPALEFNNPPLTSLNFENINLGSLGLKDLATQIKLNTSLRSLNFKNNSLSARSVNQFLDIMEENNFTLTSLMFDEGKKGSVEKDMQQYQYFSLDSLGAEILPNVSENDIFKDTQKRINRLISFNQQVVDVHNILIFLFLLIKNSS